MKRALRSLRDFWVRMGWPVPKMLLGKLVWMHAELFRSKQTELHVLRWIEEALQPGDVCFDVGAHHGWMSLVAARKVGSKGKVVAFEPTPALVRFLSFMKRSNRLQQLDVVAKAVADKDEAATPFRVVGSGNSSMNSLSGLQVPENAELGSSVIEIETVTLDTFANSAGLIPNLIKIDTEGAELLVCRGAKNLIATHRPTLIIAVHPLWLPEGQHIDELFQMLNDLGYRVAASELTEYEGAQFGDYLFLPA